MTSRRQRQSPRPRLGRLLLPAVALALCLGAGCRRSAPATPATPAGAPPAKGYQKEVVRGPATLRLAVDKSQLTIAERLTLTLDLEVGEDHEVTLPAFGDKLEQFGIVDYQKPMPELLTGKRLRHRQRYTIEPFLSGEYKIPPLTAQFWKKGETEKHEIASEEFTITVTSVLGKDGQPTLEDIAPPVTRPAVLRRWRYYAVGGAAAAALLAGAVVALVRRRRHGPGAAALRRDPFAVAYDELAALRDAKLVESGDLKQFYQRLSAILRRYLEDRFALRAPERTTEEFLAELRTNPALAPPHQALLRDFLEHCDLVKFAEHQPDHPAIQRSFDLCRRFLDETHEVPRAP